MFALIDFDFDFDFDDGHFFPSDDSDSLCESSEMTIGWSSMTIGFFFAPPFFCFEFRNGLNSGLFKWARETFFWGDDDDPWLWIWEETFIKLFCAAWK